jgi:hypothetical protein
MMHVFEYQWRGLPHFHMVVKLENVPDFSDKEAVKEFIDEFIFAEMPRKENFPNLTPVKLETYRETISAHMVHKCAAAINGCKKHIDDLCKHGYSRTEIEPETWNDSRGYWHYRRRSKQDLRVVPHNDIMCLDWCGHLNVEYSGTVERVLYLYKYLYKGVKKQNVTVSSHDPEENSEDEIKLFLKAQVLCSMDAVWRTLGFQTYPKSFPSVKTIKAKLPVDVDFLIAKKQLCDLYIYFCRPAELLHFKYTDFFNTYSVTKHLSSFAPASNGVTARRPVYSDNLRLILLLLQKNGNFC